MFSIPLEDYDYEAKFRIYDENDSVHYWYHAFITVHKYMEVMMRSFSLINSFLVILLVKHFQVFFFKVGKLFGVIKNKKMAEKLQKKEKLASSVVKGTPPP